MARINGYELLESGATFAPSIPGRERIVDLINKGIIEDGEFLGIQFDPRHKVYEVWCGSIKRFAYLKAAKKYLTRLVPDWETKI